MLPSDFSTDSGLGTPDNHFDDTEDEYKTPLDGNSIEFNSSGFDDGIIGRTFEEIEIGPYMAYVEANIAYNYSPGEPMVMYDRDGSGYPGSPDDVEAKLASIDILALYDANDNEVCEWNRGEGNGDLGIITPELLGLLEQKIDKILENDGDLATDVAEDLAGREEGAMEDRAESNKDQWESKSVTSTASLTSNSYLNLIGESDKELFESELERSGVKIVGFRDADPLRTSVQSESIGVIAGLIEESVDDRVVVSDTVKLVMPIAEAYGYIVEVRDGEEDNAGPKRTDVAPDNHFDDTEDEYIGPTYLSLKLRNLFDECLENAKPHDQTVFITVDEIAEIVGEFNESTYGELDGLSNEYTIGEEQGGFYVSRHP
mgnify:CR=1 FL=1|tara:strand:- start:680 stop:1798 length:1119 start_codon:yes stop_codon:yes gene_type:complete